MNAMLSALGNPEADFRAIHIAGTNGKGSTAVMTASILEEAGFTVGLYTSPHLEDECERVQIWDGTHHMIDQAHFDELKDRVRAIEDKATVFEVYTAAAYLYFAEMCPDYVVLETGLGGRLDSTNTLEKPLVTVITQVGLDHTAELGSTIFKIAHEKAGIIKKGVPVVYDASDREAAELIREKAAAAGSPGIPVYPQMAQITARSDKSIDFVLNNRYYDYVSARVPFPADYQVQNAALAMTALRVFDPEKKIPDETVLQAVSGTRWGGRMETAAEGIILDGAHNADGIRNFLKTVRRIAGMRPVSLLFTAAADKDYPEMIREICTQVRFEFIVTTQLDGPRAVRAESLAELFRSYTDVPVTAEADCLSAFREAAARRGDSILFCAGSLYMVGEIRGELIRQSRDKNQA